ncbi:C40 family peptidase [Phascolarctobacterium succinatutens]|uniref:C40 family peptidase n=1 Tax=Phascolarctobacterium succinatutens TaxID=626940 RepID=UPI0026EF2C30|nr:NlpC/P60 family protein [Phascolarctobacterium succinatutens]
MKMKKKLASMLTVIMLACSLPWQAQAAAPVVSNKPHKAPVATPPAVSEAQPVKAVPEPVAVKADAAAKPAAGVKAPKQAKPEQKPKKAAKKKSKKTKEKQSKVQVQQSNWRLKVAQQKLQVLGFSDERPSGRMTEATISALKSFQKQHKLKADGELNDATYQKLTWEAFAKEGIPKVKGKEIVSRAAKYKGVPYVFGGTTTKGFDCSGYVQYVFKDCKAKLPRLADEQALQGIFVTQKQLRPGDLVFFTTYAAGASHVGIYAGDGQFWSASSSKGVMLSSLKDDYWKQRYYGARRVLITNGEVYK